MTQHKPLQVVDGEELAKIKPYSRTPEYSNWVNMKARCFNSALPGYKNYGGRGVTICERWMIFANFLEDMGNKPSPAFSLERRNNNGNYEPSNCIWANRAVQNRNKRVNGQNVSGYVGVRWLTRNKKWRAQITVNEQFKSLGLFDDIQDAVKARVAGELKYWGEVYDHKRTA